MAPRLRLAELTGQVAASAFAGQAFAAFAAAGPWPELAQQLVLRLAVGLRLRLAALTALVAAQLAGQVFAAPAVVEQWPELAQQLAPRLAAGLRLRPAGRAGQVLAAPAVGIAQTGFAGRPLALGWATRPSWWMQRAL